jgi:tRNA-2-methylthio-N6-dimethylallyladenosine synthase
MLKLMNRNYSFDEYLGEIDLLRSLISNIAITSDIISGFPDESDEDHLASVNALRQIQFDGIFAFKFSSRPHTRASVMKGQISEYVKSQRLNEIIKIQNEITELKNKTLVGTIQEVLIEGCYKDNADMLMGRTRTNKVISILSSTTLNKGAIIKAKIIQSGRHSLMAEPLI